MLEGNLFRIKPDKLETWKLWCHTLSNELRDEAIETLKEEGMTQEAFVVFELNNDYFTIGLGDGQCLPTTDREINRKHKQMGKECLEKIGKVSCLYNFNLKGTI